MHVEYDTEANILSFELGGGDITYAKEMNGTIIHFSEGGKPVLIEILKASSFITRLKKIKGTSKSIRTVPSPST